MGGLAPIGFAEPRLVQCQRCRGTGNEHKYGITPCVACDGVCGHNADDWPLATLAHNLAIGGALEYEHECAIQEERAMDRGTFPPMCLCGHQADRWGRAKCPACWGSP